jgi:hypothetical protein
MSAIQPQSEKLSTPAATSVDAGVAVSTPAVPLNETSSPAAPAEPERRQRTEGPTDGVERRKNVVDRRAGLDRRVVDLGSPTGLERRRGPGRRRTDDRRSAEEGEMSDEQFEFVMAIDTYKRLNNRPFPTWTEVLEVVKQLGYRKVAASTIRLPNNNGRAST